MAQYVDGWMDVPGYTLEEHGNTSTTEEVLKKPEPGGEPKDISETAV